LVYVPLNAHIFQKKRINIALSSVKAVLRRDNNQAQLRFLGKIGSIHCYFKKL